MTLTVPPGLADSMPITTTRVVPLAGVAPLRPRVADWMRDALQDQRLFEWVENWGSPLHLHSLVPFGENVRSLQEVAEQFDLSLMVQFARKANKCLAFVDESRRLGCGVDVASERELQQAIAAGLPGDRIVCTAAIKERALLDPCVQHGVSVVIDNADELQLARSVAAPNPLRILLRVSGFALAGAKLNSALWN